MKSRTLHRSRYSAPLLARVAAGWRRLAGDERHGVFTAAQVAADLATLDAPPAVLVLAAHVVQDEVHHLEVCTRLLEELEPEGAPPPRLEIALGAIDASPAREADLARRLVGHFALGKPVTAASFAAARALVREPLFAWAYTELLHDETRHATFGAKAAAWVIRHWPAQKRQALWTRVPHQQRRHRGPPPGRSRGRSPRPPPRRSRQHPPPLDPPPPSPPRPASHPRQRPGPRSLTDADHPSIGASAASESKHPKARLRRAGPRPRRGGPAGGTTLPRSEGGPVGGTQSPPRSGQS